ncbi:MAG TPA: pseudouridine synthase [Bryobacteraceae bacterium]|nr:pseudouridine synthase [Bryobacteraceae bacterium]
MANAGVTSRRKAEELILEGRVAVNGQVITELGTKADITVDHIKVDGKVLRPPSSLVYLAFHKPRGVVTTVYDPEGRPTVMDFIKGVKQRVYPVGRLDYASEGLLLLTNDGDFAHKAMAASTHLEKVYLVKSNGPLSPEQEDQFRTGVFIEGHRTAPAGIKLVRRAINPWFEVKLIEGRHRQIRLMFQFFGRMAEKIKRVKIGFLELGQLKPGEFRHLTPAEVARFRRILKLDGGVE